MALNPQYDAIGKGFVQQYYTLFDDLAQRPNLANMYNVSFISLLTLVTLFELLFLNLIIFCCNFNQFKHLKIFCELPPKYVVYEIISVIKLRSSITNNGLLVILAEKS